MIENTRAAKGAIGWTGACGILLVVSLVLMGSCSDDPVGPEPEAMAPIQAIAYMDRGVGDLNYVEKTGEYWGTPEVVTYRGDIGYYSSLAFDAKGVPHIAYYDRTNMDLAYATRTQDGWQRVTVDYGGNVGGRCAIALDPQGIPYISYLDHTNGHVKCAWKVDGAWIIKTLPGDPPYLGLLACREDWAYSTSIAVDADGNPHVSYYTDSRKLGYVVRDSHDEWSYEIADNNGNVGFQCSIVLDLQGHPHVSYLSYPDFHVKYAEKVSGVWQTEIITVGDLAQDCAHYTDLALDSQGNPHICFQTSGSALGYLTRSTPGAWSFEVVDESSANIGLYSSIVVDAQGTPYMSYHDYPNNTLKYAVRTDNGWATAVVDDQGNAGWYSSMCMCYR